MSEHSRSPRQPRKRADGPGGKSSGKGGRPTGSRSGKAGIGKGSTGARFAGSTKPSQPTRLPQRPDKPAVDVHDPDGIRLQKLMAAGGVGSRRVCEGLIEQGRVEVDGNIVTELGVRIDPKRQVVHVDGVRVNLDDERVYLAFNKPKGVVTTMHDDLGRISLEDYVGNREERLFHVGRLDADTEGLLLLTNDGDLAHRLQHPAYGVLKTYLADDPRAGRSRRRPPAARGCPARGRPRHRRLVPRRRLPTRQGARRGRPARGPQARRAPDARGRRTPGARARAHRGRSDPPRRPQARPDPPAQQGRGRRALQGRRPVTPTPLRWWQRHTSASLR